jgi:23S rRNA (guanosine2251-2'-O)-methyltransferase
LYISGRRAVAEAIQAGVATEVLVAAGAKGLGGLEHSARRSGVSVRSVERAELDSLVPDNHGVAARISADPSKTLGERELALFDFEDDAVVVILDGITDPQNLGAAARSAEAAGVSMVVTRKRRSADVSAAAIRASAGSLLHLTHARVANLARAIGRLQDSGFMVIGLDPEADQTIYEEPCPRGRVALVVGGEGAGISRLVRERCDRLVSLPMRGEVDSLNASASLAVALYAYVLPSRGRSERA